MKYFIRLLLIVGGTLSVALGVVGMLLPVLPTTPFLLLGAVCYARSSERFHHWLITNRLCGSYIRNYQEGRGLPPGQKITTIALLWMTIGATAWMAVSSWWLRAILLVIAVGVTIHLLKLKTCRREKESEQLIGTVESTGEES